jgi:Secretion system C-terminal sorting domain/Pregnancy-associated plasma protein-A
MKKTIKFGNIFLLLVASFLMLTKTLNAQDCILDDDDTYTPVPESVYSIFPPNTGSGCIPSEYGYEINIIFRIIRTSNGSGGTTPAELEQAIAIMQQDFGPHFRFQIESGPNYDIHNDDYYYGNAYKLSPTGASPPLFSPLLLSYPRINGALNVYLGPSNNPNDGGVASPSRGVCTLAGTRAESSGNNYLVVSHALSHEVAHLFDLQHTFYRTGSQNFNPQGNPLGGINALIPAIESSCGSGNEGDGVCDTPVDPTQPDSRYTQSYFDFRPLLSNCLWKNKTKRDASGRLYGPVLTNNIMAYTHVSCMESFTPGQIKRMLYACATSIYLTNVVTFWKNCTDYWGLKALAKTEHLELKVFPNPSSDLLAIQFLSESQETLVQVTDVVGRVLYTRNLGRTIKNDIKEIDIKNLPKGVHILTVSNAIDKNVTKIVIQ